MLGKLGAKGIVGVLAILGGLALVALQDPLVAAGIALVLVGLLLTAWGLVSGMLSAMGMDGMLG